MANLTPNQIAQLAYNAGFRGSALRMAVAIAIAESNGDPNAYNPEIAAGTPKNHGSRGLWQIYGQAHPEYNSNEMYNPVANAQAAYKVYQQAGNKFTPWSTYNNGSAYKISQNLNVDIPSSAVVMSPNDVTMSVLTGGAVGSLTGGGALGALTGAGSAVGFGEAQQAVQSPLVQVSLLPDNVKKGIENLDPNFVKKSIVFGFLGFLFLTIGLVMLISALTPQGVKDLAGEGAKTAVAAAMI